MPDVPPSNRPSPRRQAPPPPDTRKRQDSPPDGPERNGKRIPWIVAIIVVVVAIVVGGFFTWLDTAGGFSARAKPTGIEAFLARTMRGLAMPSRAAHLKNPYPPTPAALAAASEHFAAHCALCHDNNGDGKTMFGDNLYPHPPDLRGFTTQGKSDGDLFFTIRNGIRLSGMPAWPDDSRREIWALVSFIRHLPQITPAELQRMRKYDPTTLYPEPLMPAAPQAKP
ncbi:MAG: c-type cytochrome [Terriglobales bacterium]